MAKRKSGNWLGKARKSMERRGTVGSFSAWARSQGMTTEQAANEVMRNKSRYSSRRVKQANFARNAMKSAKSRRGQ